MLIAANDLLDVLIDECGVQRDHDSLIEQLTLTWERYNLDSNYRNLEFRFCGSLGFGGKVYSTKRFDGSLATLRVNCYQEDTTPERREAIVRANLRLAALIARQDV